MSRRPDSPQHSRVVVFVTLAVVAMLVLYVLSIGPLTWLHHQGIAAWNGVAPFYAPLEWLGKAIPPIGELLRRYKQVWEG